MSRIQVVSAAIVFAGRVMLAQRAAETSHAFKWCTPGGKIEPGEESSAALRRELREELSIGLADVTPVDVVYQADVGDRVHVTCYRVDWGYVVDSPSPGDKTAGVGWFTPEQLRSLDLAPADAANVDKIVAAIAVA